ncbi:unnamed protein product [Prorocentrum cordatum]|uniref:Uncharacterized protein n=1 Tax=Prorocentrum cordatum TaxID=2364126 RepID=A0ABN9XN62_9DINO|nr:unnamed protein product [Polarella glacialis]
MMCSLQLHELPDEIGEIKSLQIIFLILQNLNATGNQIKALPAPFEAPELHSLSIGGNAIESFPCDLLSTCPKLRSLSTAGNPIGLGLAGSCSSQWLCSSGPQISSLEWAYLQGCRLERLPESFLRPCVRTMKHLLLNGNRLHSPLPDALKDMHALESLYLCGNNLNTLPEGLLMACATLSRCLLEDNPLSVEALSTIRMRDVRARESGRPLRLLGLDASQVRRWSSTGAMMPPSLDHARAASDDQPPLGCRRQGGSGCEQSSPQAALPPCVQSGWSVMPGSPWYGKLIPSSQLRRAVGAATLGERAGEEEPTCDAGSRVLMIAFAASQGEPEWAGELGRLHEQRQYEAALRQYALRPTLSEHVEQMRLMYPQLPKTVGGNMASLWAGHKNLPMELCTDGQPPPLDNHDNESNREDFDVLLLVDPHRSWYTEEPASSANVSRSSFREHLERITAPYRRVCALGASMGGFASLSHADLFDAVLAFGPQIELELAHHRPGFEVQDLAAMSGRMRRAVRNRRGTVEAHTSMDNHLAQAQLFHSEGSLAGRAARGRRGALRLVVHPLLGRIARLLEKRRAAAAAARQHAEPTAG